MRISTSLTSAAAIALILGAAAVTTGGAAVATATVTRYAAPTGSGDECTPVEPCSLTTAVNSAPAHAVIKVATGFYFTAGDPTTITLDASSVPLRIEGVGGAGSTAPVIFSAAAPGITVGPGSVVSNVWLTSSATASAAIVDEGGQVDHATFRAFGTACDLEDSAFVLDSLCWSNAAGDDGAIYAQFGEAGTVTLRGVTAVQSGGGPGLQVAATTFGGSGTLDATNSILNGGTVGDVDLDAASGQALTVTLSHCDLRTTLQQHSGGTISLSATDTVKARPTYADPGVHRFEEAPRSPTINAGAPDQDTDHTDLDGQPRTIGRAPDIGAYEITQRPTVRDLRVARAGLRTSRAMAAVTVNASGDPTTISYRLTRKRHKAVVTTEHGGQSALAVSFDEVLRHLTAHTTYMLVVVARNSLGSASSHSVRFTTRRRSHHKR